MHYLIEKLLKKRGIKDSSQLESQEHETFDRWSRILSEGEISVEKIKNFCQYQLQIIESKWKELDNTNLKNERLIIMHNVYKAILDAIDKPAKERENLEKYLQQLVDN